MLCATRKTVNYPKKTGPIKAASSSEATTSAMKADTTQFSQSKEHQHRIWPQQNSATPSPDPTHAEAKIATLLEHIRSRYSKALPLGYACLETDGLPHGTKSTKLR